MSAPTTARSSPPLDTELAAPEGDTASHEAAATAACTDQNTGRADILAYLNACFGDLTGRVHAAIGRGPYVTPEGKYKHRSWVENHAAWPDDAEAFAGAMVEAGLSGDLYVNPYLKYGAQRVPGGTVARNLVHADVDDYLDPQKVVDLGGFAVSSGTRGGGHVYVPLSQSIPANQHEALERALVAHLGADPAKISSNDLLRPPGTLNHKPTVFTPGAAPTAVAWLVRPHG